MEKGSDKIHIDKGEGRFCADCHQKILPGEEYFLARRRTGWYAHHIDRNLCDKRRKERITK